MKRTLTREAFFNHDTSLTLMEIAVAALRVSDKPDVIEYEDMVSELTFKVNQLLSDTKRVDNAFQIRQLYSRLSLLVGGLTRIDHLPWLDEEAGDE